MDYPVELESQFIMRLPEEPARVLKNVLNTGENFKKRLSIQIDNDMRYGEVRFDHWLLHGKIVDLPTIVESLKTIDRKTVYKTADICQMMICKDEIDPASADESPNKNKRKDPLKVDKKYLWPHGITPPTKNVRKRRFRKTLKKKSADGPDIEKEVKRLLRADYEADSMTWELIHEDKLKPEANAAGKLDRVKKESVLKVEATQSSSKVEDIFGETLSDSDLDDENINIDVDGSQLSSYGEHYSDFLVQDPAGATQFSTEIFKCNENQRNQPSMSEYSTGYINAERKDNSNISFKIQQVATDLEELKQRRHKTQQEIVKMENMALRQRFQDILQALNKDIKYKELEFQGLQSLLP